MGANIAVNPKLFEPGAIRFVLYNGTYNRKNNRLTDNPEFDTCKINTIRQTLGSMSSKHSAKNRPNTRTILKISHAKDIMKLHSAEVFYERIYAKSFRQIVVRTS